MAAVRLAQVSADRGLPVGPDREDAATGRGGEGRAARKAATPSRPRNQIRNGGISSTTSSASTG